MLSEDKYSESLMNEKNYNESVYVKPWKWQININCSYKFILICGIMRKNNFKCNVNKHFTFLF